MGERGRAGTTGTKQRNDGEGCLDNSERIKPENVGKEVISVVCSASENTQLLDGELGGGREERRRSRTGLPVSALAW